MAGNPDRYRQKKEPLSTSNEHVKVHSLLILTLIIALLADSLLSDISSIVNRILPESSRIVLFSTLSGIIIFSGTLVILDYSKRLRTSFGPKNKLQFLVSRIIPIVQYAIIAVLAIITAQIIFAHQYIALFLFAYLISWLAGVTLIGMVSLRFIQWYRSRRNLVVLLYFVMTLLTCIILTLAAIPQIFITAQTSFISVNSHTTEVKPFQANPDKLGILFVVISIANWLVIPLSLIIWVTIAVMLSGYSTFFGRSKYWMLLSAPLASVVIGVISLFIFLPTVNTIFDQQVILYTMMAFGGMLVEGFLLSFVFVTISKNVRHKANINVNNSLGISAVGVVIFFVCYFSNPSIGSYLPFGVLSASFVVFGAYLFFLGIHASAVSISSDVRLRQSIRRSLLDQSKLLDNIGLADINRELEQQTKELLQKHRIEMHQETGLEYSMSESDAKQYAVQVLAEIQKTQEGKHTGQSNKDGSGR